MTNRVHFIWHASEFPLFFSLAFRCHRIVARLAHNGDSNEWIGALCVYARAEYMRSPNGKPSGSDDVDDGDDAWLRWKEINFDCCCCRSYSLCMGYFFFVLLIFDADDWISALGGCRHSFVREYVYQLKIAVSKTIAGPSDDSATEQIPTNRFFCQFVSLVAIRLLSTRFSHFSGQRKNASFREDQKRMYRIMGFRLGLFWRSSSISA